VLFSIFYHDFYYFPKKNDNEFQSAEKLKISLQNIVPEELIIKCYDYIIATKNHEVSANNSDKDLLFFLDFDMSILGSSLDNYREYLYEIRQEYSEYSKVEFSERRIIFLKKSLSNQPIFKTLEVREQFELHAVNNLKDEVFLNI